MQSIDKFQASKRRDSFYFPSQKTNFKVFQFQKYKDFSISKRTSCLWVENPTFQSHFTLKVQSSNHVQLLMQSIDKFSSHIFKLQKVASASTVTLLYKTNVAFSSYISSYKKSQFQAHFQAQNVVIRFTFLHKVQRHFLATFFKLQF